MNFHLSCFSPSGSNTQKVDCLVISQNSKVTVVAPRLSQTKGRILKAVYHLEVSTGNSLSPEYYDLSKIDTIDSNRVSAKVRGWLTSSNAQQLEFFLRSMLAPRFSADQSIYSGLIATYKFDESANENTFNKARPVLIIKTWGNERALVLPITSSTSKNDYRQLLHIGQLGNLKKKSSIALNHWYTVSIQDLDFHANAQLPLLATLLTQARCQQNWAA